MAFLGEDGSYFVIIHAIARQGDRSISHLGSSCEFGNAVDPHLDLSLIHI